MPETNLIIELKIELSIPKKKGGAYIVSLRDVDLYSIANSSIKELNVVIDDKPRGAGSSGDKPRGAGAIGDKPRGAGSSGDKPRGAGASGDKPRGAGASGDKPRGAGGRGDKPRKGKNRK